MWEAKERGRSETRENDSQTSAAEPGPSAPDCSAVESSGLNQPFRPRLRNLTGRDCVLIYRSEDGTEVTRRLPAEENKIRVRYNRLFDSAPTEWYSDPEGSNAKIPMVESRPREGLLETCETIDGLPPPEGGVRLIVDPFVVFGLARRGVFRRDLLTLGRVRRDFDTRRVVGFEGLSRVNFDRPPDLAEVPSLSDPEV